MKTQLHAVNACVKRSSQRSFNFTISCLLFAFKNFYICVFSVVSAVDDDDVVVALVDDDDDIVVAVVVERSQMNFIFQLLKSKAEKTGNRCNTTSVPRPFKDSQNKN